VADDALLDLAGALEDGGETGVAPVALDLVFSGVAIAPVHLDAVAGDLDRHLGGQQLHHGRFLLALLPEVDEVRHLAVERTRLLHARRHLGDLEADRLEVADRMLELHSRLRVGDAVLYRATSQAHCARRGVHAGHVEPGLRGGEGAALSVAGEAAADVAPALRPRTGPSP